MIKLIKEGYESWKQTPFTLFYNGEKHTLSKYTKDQFSDHPKMVIPQYNRETDTLYYIGIIDGEDVGEKFINSSEAMEYLENYYTYGYTYDESIKRNKRRMKEGLSHSLEVKLQDFAQEYGKITYDDITKLGNCWDSLNASDKKEIQKLVSDVRKACKEAGMDAGELSSEYPEDKKTCDALVKAVKGACKSEKIKESRKRINEDTVARLLKENNDPFNDIYREVARIVRYMNWREYLDYDYDTPEEDWDAFVQSCAEFMDDNPFSVIQWLNDLTDDYPEINDVIDQIARFYAKDFGIYARDFNTAIRIILKFNNVEDAEYAWEELPNIHDDETYGESNLTGAADYTQTVLEDNNCTGYFEINRREIDKNMIGNALYYDYQIYYIVNGNSWFDVL